MILKYGVSNFFCFNEGIEISFELNANCPKSISKGKSYSNIVCVKGANGSGKTNALRALDFFANFCANSFSNKPEDPIKFESFFSAKEPTEFYVEFLISNVNYRYELILTREEILTERIYRKLERTTLVIERENNNFKKIINEYSDLKEIKKLRSNASIISTGNQYELKSISHIYSFFETITSNLYINAIHRFDQNIISIISRYYNNFQDVFEFVKNILRKCDLGIKDIIIEHTKDSEGNDDYFPLFIHEHQGKQYKLSFFHQSSGTQSLFIGLFRYRFALTQGGVLILDEFDTTLHPHILPLLLELFIDKDNNPNDCQLIFTTHNDKIMEYMGKYRTILVVKDDNESFSYRLDEIPGDILRNDRPISPIYNDGKIGGIPKINQND